MFFTKELSPRLSDNPSKRKDVSRHIINKKADAKLNYVSEKYKSALGAYVESTRDRFLDKDILFKNLRYLKELNMVYKIENRFWAISYDLIYKTYMSDIKDYGPEIDCTYKAKLKGKMRISAAEFVANTDEEKVNEILTKLNNPLILHRISSLDLTDFNISYRADSREWTISFRSLIGSTTWNFIPPVTYLIKPKEEEYIQIIEIFELIGDALINP